MYTLIIDNHTTNHDTLRDLILFLESLGLTTSVIVELLKEGHIRHTGKDFQVTKDTD